MTIGRNRNSIPRGKSIHGKKLVWRHVHYVWLCIDRLSLNKLNVILCCQIMFILRFSGITVVMIIFLIQGSIMVDGHELHEEDLRLMYTFDQTSGSAAQYEAHSDSQVIYTNTCIRYCILNSPEDKGLKQKINPVSSGLKCLILYNPSLLHSASKHDCHHSTVPRRPVLMLCRGQACLSTVMSSWSSFKCTRG